MACQFPITMAELRFPKKPGIENGMTITLVAPLNLDRWIVPSGTKIITYQTDLAGWVMLPNPCKDIRGRLIPRHLFQF